MNVLEINFIKGINGYGRGYDLYGTKFVFNWLLRGLLLVL